MVATDSAFFKGLLLVAILAPSIGCAAGYKKTPPSTNSTGPVTVQLTPPTSRSSQTHNNSSLGPSRVQKCERHVVRLQQWNCLGDR